MLRLGVCCLSCLTGSAQQRCLRLITTPQESSKLAKYPFEPYWPEKKLKICITGAGGFIASHLGRRLKAEGHYIVACDWKRNDYFKVGGRYCFDAIKRQ